MRAAASPHAPRRSGHVVVIGASIAGLCMAHALSRHFARVTVVERDLLLPEHDGPRKGVPQGSQLHLLQARGARDLQALFPGLVEELACAGAPVLHDFARVHAEVGGYPQHRGTAIGAPLVLASRPFLEGRIRARALPGLDVLAGHEVLGLVAEGTRIVGVRVHGPGGDGELPADLVVDAGGRGGRCSAWLEAVGLEQPTEECIEVDIRYSAAVVEMPERLPGDDACLAIAATPDRPWGLGVLRQEGNRWIVNAYGYSGYHPPADPHALLQLAAGIVPPAWRDALLAAQWPDRVATARFPRSVRRHYGRVAAPPQGLVVAGDALCSFNPIYGQGMTIGVVEALAIDACLAAGRDHLERRFYAAVDRPVTTAWQLGAVADLRFPGVVGQRQRIAGALLRYVDAVQAAASDDPRVGSAFWRVSSLLDPPTAMFAPPVLLRVAGHRLSRRRRVAAAGHHHRFDQTEVQLP